MVFQDLKKKNLGNLTFKKMTNSLLKIMIRKRKLDEEKDF